MMSRFYACVGLLMLLAGVGYCQQIEMIRTFGGVRFKSDTIDYSPRQVQELMRDTPLAFEEFKKARTNYGLSGALGAVGGVLVALPVGTAIAGGEPEWSLAAGGAALIIATIPLNRTFRNHSQRALDIYNGRPSSRVNTKFYFGGSFFKVIIHF